MRVSSVQLEIKDRAQEETLRHVLALLDQTRGSDLVLLPELWPCGFFAFSHYRESSESVQGPTVQAMQAKARDLRTHLLMGSFVEQEGRDLFNTTLLLGPDGQVLARYRKIHLFGYQSEEKKLLRRGEEVTVVPTPWGRAGLATCYDLRFPELFRRMLDQGAEFFLVVSAWPQPRLEAWTLFNRARAHENLAYLFSCNAAGQQGSHRYGGHSLFVDPRGKVQAEGGDGECILSADIDMGQVAAVRREFPALHDRVLCERRQAMLKEHLEFFTLDLTTGWENMPGYPAGVQQKVLSGHLDHERRKGSRTRLLRFLPGTFTTEPFIHEYWEEIFQISGTLTVGGQTFGPMTYACRPPHVWHGPFRSDEGCLLLEIHYFHADDNT